MLRKILRIFRPSPPNPTEHWPQIAIKAPSVDWCRGIIGELRFGDNLELAQKFGRPDIFRSGPKNYCELIYANSGFQIDFYADRLEYAAFFIGPDSRMLEIPSPAFSTPRINGILVSRETSLKTILSSFGPPKSQDNDPEETVLLYTNGKIELEFEFGPAGKLKHVSLWQTPTV